ncbi:MAG: hypothetical protein ACRCTP_22870 [Aeromonas popoffii]|uniref:hypothetical protein n=1 Tax=Aeromonas popoffii TaxID=70856 RepID=UPI003F325F6B
MMMPVNHNQPAPQDLRIMDAMFGSSASTTPIATKLVIPGLFFFVLGMPFVDNFLKGLITTSDLVLLAIKTGLFLALLVVAQLLGW